MDEASEQTHRLTDTTYRNIEELVVDLKGLVDAAKVYHKAMENMALASKDFFTTMESFGAKAANLPGAVRKLGDSMKEMARGYKQVNKQYGNWLNSLNSDFVVPLETKLESEAKTFTSMHKMYKQDNAKRQVLVEKTSGKLKGLNKKKNLSRADMEKESQLRQVLADHSVQLHSTRVEGLRKALLEERKLYCFVVDHFCSVVHNEIAYNALSHRVFSTKVIEWSALCSSPNELPPESTALLMDPRSPRAFSSSLSGERLSRDQREEREETDTTAPQNGRTRSRRISCRVKALYPHQPGYSSQLDFTPGDLIDAIDDPQEGWQFGENIKTGRSGWFPVQYVDRIWPSPEPVQRRVATATGKPSSLQSPPIPEKDYLSSSHTHQRPGSAGHHGETGHTHQRPSSAGYHGDLSQGHMTRKPSQSSVTSPGYRQ